MYVNPFWMGVFCTVSVLVSLLLGLAIYLSIKTNRKGD